MKKRFLQICLVMVLFLTGCGSVGGMKSSRTADNKETQVEEEPMDNDTTDEDISTDNDTTDEDIPATGIPEDGGDTSLLLSERMVVTECKASEPKVLFSLDGIRSDSNSFKLNVEHFNGEDFDHSVGYAYLGEPFDYDDPTHTRYGITWWGTMTGGGKSLTIYDPYGYFKKFCEEDVYSPSNPDVATLDSFDTIQKFAEQDERYRQFVDWLEENGLSYDELVNIMLDKGKEALTEDAQKLKELGSYNK